MTQKENKNNRINWKEGTTETYRIALNSSELLLKETIHAGEFQIKRAYDVLRPSLALLIIVSGYLLSTKPSWGLLFIEGVTFAICLSVLIVVSFRAYKVSQVKPIGNYPFSLLSKEMLKFGGKETDKAIYYTICDYYERSIRFNEDENSKRATRLHWMETIIKISIAVLIFVPIVFEYFSLLFSLEF